MITGIRHDDNSIYGSSTNPRIGATWQPCKQLVVKGNYGTAFQAPAPRNLYGSWSGLTVNSSLEPDRIKSWDLGAIWMFAKSTLEVVGYYNEITRSIMQGENLPKKDIWGAECKFNWHLAKQLGTFICNMRVQANYTFTHSRYNALRSDATSGRTSYKVGGIAPHKLNLLLDADLFHKLHANIRLNFVDERPTTVTNPIPTVASYTIVHASLQYRNLAQGVTAYLTVNNLFDTDYYHPGYDKASAGENVAIPSQGWYSSRLPQPGRVFMLGIRFDIK